VAAPRQLSMTTRGPTPPSSLLSKKVPKWRVAARCSSQANAGLGVYLLSKTEVPEFQAGFACGSWSVAREANPRPAGGSTHAGGCSTASSVSGPVGAMDRCTRLAFQQVVQRTSRRKRSDVIRWFCRFQASTLQLTLARPAWKLVRWWTPEGPQRATCWCHHDQSAGDRREGQTLRLPPAWTAGRSTSNAWNTTSCQGLPKPLY